MYRCRESTIYLRLLHFISIEKQGTAVSLAASAVEYGLSAILNIFCLEPPLQSFWSAYCYLFDVCLHCHWSAGVPCTLAVRPTANASEEVDSKAGLKLSWNAALAFFER
jgi:hypothetical protein